MSSLTISDIDDDVERGLRMRATRKGVSVESEARAILSETVRKAADSVPTEEEREAKLRRILALGIRPAEPFDLKAFSDALSDGTE